MDEHDLREAFRSTMTKSRPPAPMSTHEAVRAGRRALLRQRLGWLGAATAAATVIAVVSVAASSQYASMRQPAGRPAIVPAPSTTVRPWPSGPESTPQDDSTARAGRQYDTGVELLNRLLGAVPDGYTALEGNADPPASPTRSHVATFVDGPGGTKIWSYSAIVQIAKDGGTGMLVVEVREPRPGTAAVEGCALTGAFWSEPGKCQDFTVGSVRVGVVLNPTPDDDRLDQWAAYRYPDGMIVYVAQAKAVYTADNGKPLAALPFTPQQLAELAGDEAFHVGA